MKRTTCLALAIILTTAICSVFAQAATGERSALQVDLGLGFTSGIDSKKALEIDNVEESAGATLRFGLTYQLPLMENFFLNPTFQMATYTEEIDFGGAQVQIDNQVVNLNSIKTKTTQINFGVKPTYYFMPATAKEYGLSLTPKDERLDPEKNARAAARVLITPATPAVGNPVIAL